VIYWERFIFCDNFGNDGGVPELDEVGIDEGVVVVVRT